MTFKTWTPLWSAAGKWLVYTGPSLDDQLSFPSDQRDTAALISAAPDLLAVVERLLAEDADGHLTIGLIEDALAAQAKAKGEGL